MGELQRYAISFKVYLSDFHNDYHIDGVTVIIKASSPENAEKQLKNSFREGLVVNIQSTTLVKPFHGV